MYIIFDSLIPWILNKIKEKAVYFRADCVG